MVVEYLRKTAVLQTLKDYTLRKAFPIIPTNNAETPVLKDGLYEEYAAQISACKDNKIITLITFQNPESLSQPVSKTTALIQLSSKHNITYFTKNLKHMTACHCALTVFHDFL